MTEIREQSAVDQCLDEMFDRLAGTGAAGRRALAELEDHLRSAVAEGTARGLSTEQAEREAVARFGATAEVAGQLRSVHHGPYAWLRPAFVGCWLAGGLGLVTVGISGLVCEVFGRLFGADFVAGDAPGVTYTAQRCADYFEYAPNAATCADAAAFHHWGEVVDSRVSAGVLGVLALLVLWLVRRSSQLGRPAWTPPRATVAVPLIAIFALIGAAFTGVSLMQLAFHDHDKAGANLSDGLVSLLAAVLVAVWLVVTNRRRRPA